MLSVLPAARCATREEKDVEAKVVQMHKDGASPRVKNNHFKGMNVLIKASDVQNIVKKANLNALSGKTHTEA
uniref:Uncharacterized protein n=1 Tax=Hyaloperonospora arabidopsidis (strain Emoy2) TaxID=559515 RepID=M4BEA9_HYAAE